jgi:sigma-E factor negative regulatory protein RseA
MTDMNSERGELISALLDGEVTAAELGPAVEAASLLPQGLAVWHAYHVVGEALRGRAPVASGADSLFLARLRGRLSEEPAGGVARPAALGVALATGPVAQIASANDALIRWKLLAGAASLAAMAVLGWHMASLPAPDATVAAASVHLGQSASAPATQPLTAPGASLAQAQAQAPQVMLRDARLDALMAAHKQYGGTSALQMPAGFLRNATFDGSER